MRCAIPSQGGIAEVSHLGIDAEDLGGGGGLQADLHQLILGGLAVDGAIAHGPVSYTHLDVYKRQDTS